jgi:Fur family transcriptional regulator, ferric uptake regulator
MAGSDRTSQMLTRHKLRHTPVRRAVLQVLSRSPFALSGHEIEQQMGSDVDRITLYRTLKTFEESGLIHRVIDTTDTVRYAACSVECSAHAHFDDHVHFKCTCCQHIYCLTQVAIPAVTLPSGFEVAARNYLLSGVCQECQAKARRPD